MDSSQWLASAVALIAAAFPAFLAWRSATLARRAADVAGIAQVEAARLQRLEARVSGQKYKAYAPLIAAFGRLLTPGQKSDDGELLEAITTFQTWAVIYASDGALRAFGQLMQGSFANAPTPITMHLYGAFVIEARRDMGDETSSISIADVFAPRLKDLYSAKDMAQIAKPIDELCAAQNWVPPWEQCQIR